LDKTELLKKEGAVLLQDIAEGMALLNPALLNKFFLLTFAVSGCSDDLIIIS